MKIIFGAQTDTGKVRSENQDSYGISSEYNVFIICDGMGGGAAGDFASRYAVDIMMRAFAALKDEEAAAIAGPDASRLLKSDALRMTASIRLANRALYLLAAGHPKLAGMGTTVTAVFFDQDVSIMHIFHVGDSRAYRFRDGVLELMTKDHSKVNELIDQGKMSEEEVKTAEIQSMITRALGTSPKVKIDYRPQYVKNGDIYMLCTDGLNGEIDDNEIKHWIEVSRTNLNTMSSRLISAANRAGGRDNTTVIALKAYDNENTPIAPDIIGDRKATTIDEESSDETRAEDKTLKKLMSRSRIQVPKNARQRVFLGNPLVLGVILAAAVAVFGMTLPKCAKQPEKDTRLIDLAGSITGIKIDVREPDKEQYGSFINSEDTVTKLQLIQDWYRDSAKSTVQLTDVRLVVSNGIKEQFNGVSGEKQCQIELERGKYTVKPSKPGYILLTEKMEERDAVDVAVEPSNNFSTVTLIMIPAQ